MNAARVRELTGKRDITRVVEILDIIRRVEAFYFFEKQRGPGGLRSFSFGFLTNSVRHVRVEIEAPARYRV